MCSWVYGALEVNVNVPESESESPWLMATKEPLSETNDPVMVVTVCIRAARAASSCRAPLSKSRNKSEPI